ncbi:aspartate aminotransferase [Achlya hypogyna]|uniref:Aspartate aminotransferase n=1 Tax=Achlya hypogyna TaxID=1202772 RepID=A0A1V9Z6W3_ACHHY|nr:aspartate aminotransferase [Achlya hypogyna]
MVKTTFAKHQTTMKVAYQGVAGAYSEKAVHQLLGQEGIEATGFPSFEAAFTAVTNGEVEYGLLPIENSVGGTIHANYDLLLRYNLHIVGEVDLPVHHCLLALPGTTKEDIRHVISHPQALAQCAAYTRNLGYCARAEYDTAGSAKMLAEHGAEWADTAAIASDLAAHHYGLEVLEENIEDDADNVTRFLLLSASPISPPVSDAVAAKTTLVISFENGTSQLHTALALFAAEGVEISKLEVRPWNVAAEKDATSVSSHKFKYLFYIDVVAHAEDSRLQSVLTGLGDICNLVRVFGTYPANAILPGEIQSALNKRHFLNQVVDAVFAGATGAAQDEVHTYYAENAAAAEAALDQFEHDFIELRAALRASVRAQSPIRLNPLLGKLSQSKTVQIHGLTKQLEAEGKTVYSLCVGEPDFNPHEQVIEAARQGLTDGLVKYTEVSGMIKLRKAISGYLERAKGVHYDPATEILVSNGAKQSVFQALLVTCEAGDHVLIPAPYWVSYPDMAKIAGAVPVFLPTNVADSYLINPQVLRETLEADPRIKVMILCNPSNPAGVVHGPELLKEIAAVLADFPHVLIIADEIYEQLVYQDEGVEERTHLCFATLLRDRTLLINGFSKSHAMTGLRVGYMAAPALYTKAATKLQGQLTSCASSIGQVAAIAALEMEAAAETPLIAGTLANMDEKRKYVCSRLDAMPHIQYAYPTGAFYVFIELPHYIGTNHFGHNDVNITNSEAFCSYLLSEFGCAIVPGSAFGIENSVRMSYATSLEVLGHSMDALEACLNSLVPH